MTKLATSVPREAIGASGSNGQRLRYIASRLSLSSIHVLDQPRKTFEAIPDLAENIALRLLLNPIIVAELTKEGLTDYLSFINDIWKVHHSIDAFTSEQTPKGPRYYVLLAGERRYRACVLLWEIGCTACQEHARHHQPGDCFRRHFEQDTVPVSLCVNIDPQTALEIQFSENIHMQVPVGEEALAYAEYYRVLRGRTGSLSKADFARRVGRSASTISNALRFSELPESVQAHVRKKEIPYGIALELARLYVPLFTESERRHWLILALVRRNVTVQLFREQLTKYIDEKLNGQMDLGLLMEAKQLELNRRAKTRRVISRATLLDIYAGMEYARTVLRTIKSGELGLPDSPYSIDSILRLLQHLGQHFSGLIPHLRELKSTPGQEERYTQLLAVNHEIEQLAQILLQGSGPQAGQIPTSEPSTKTGS